MKKELRLVPLEGWVVCLSEDHGLTVHDKGDTNPYGYEKPSCKRGDHRPLLWKAREEDPSWL